MQLESEAWNLLKRAGPLRFEKASRTLPSDCHHQVNTPQLGVSLPIATGIGLMQCSQRGPQR